MRIGEGMWTSAKKKLLLTPSAITEAEIQSQTKDGLDVLDEDYSESRLQRRFVSATGYLLCTIPVRAVLAFMTNLSAPLRFDRGC